jgi:DNA transposition AAA+ family ATPase
MRDDFVPTQNFQRTQALCDELLNSALGVEMAAITGRAGLGKTTAAERLFTHTKNAVYVLYQEKWKYLELLREITFKLCGTRPRYRQTCFEMIANELAVSRRIIMVDEADSMNLTCLNVIRNIHDVLHVPVLLIGEDTLLTKLNKERRLKDRLRASIAYQEVSQADVVVFYAKLLRQKLTSEHTARLLKHAGGSFRRVLTDAVKAERIMKSSGLSVITDAVVEAVLKEEK